MENKENRFKQIFVTRTQGFIAISKKSDFWKELANDLGGAFKIKFTVSKDLEILDLVIPYKDEQIEFTESDAQPLKINCVLKAKLKLEFFISFEDFIEKLLKVFGQQDIQVGEDVFDKKYLIQGSDPEAIRNIMQPEVKAILLRNNVFSLNCTFQKNDNTLTLMSLVSRTVNSKAEMAELYKLFCLTIDKLIELEFI
jgi:hypothetical protein